MKRLLAWFLCLMLLGVWMLPVTATEATVPTENEEALPANSNGSHVMAVVCLVILVAGGIYLFVSFRKSGRL